MNVVGRRDGRSEEVLRNEGLKLSLKVRRMSEARSKFFVVGGFNAAKQCENVAVPPWFLLFIIPRLMQNKRVLNA